MDRAKIISLIDTGENETVEFKSSFQKETIASLVAFANTMGGQVLIGVDDNGTIKGVDVNVETIQNYINIIKQNTIPAVIPDIHEVSIDNKLILVIDVKEYPLKPVSFKGKYYKRVKNSNHLMAPVEISDMYLKVLNLSWDAYGYPDESIGALDKLRIQKFLKKVNETGRFSIDEEPLVILESSNLSSNINQLLPPCFFLRKNHCV